MKPFENSFWYQQNAAARVQNDSAELIANLVSETKLALKPTINITNFSTTRYVVDKRTPLVPVDLYQLNTDGSQKNMTSLELYKAMQRGIRIPSNAFASGGSDATMIIEDICDDTYFDGYAFSRASDGKPRFKWAGLIYKACGSNGIFPIINGEMQGAAATGLPWWPGVISRDDINRGYINHLMRFSLSSTGLSTLFKFPALRNDAGAATNTGKIKYGQVFKLPTNTSIPSTTCPLMRMIIHGAISYGFIICDRSACITLYVEDYRPHTTINPITSLLGNLTLANAMLQIPWDKMQAVEF